MQSSRSKEEEAAYKRTLRFIYKPPGSLQQNDRLSAGTINPANYLPSTQRYTPSNMGQNRPTLATTVRTIAIAQRLRGRSSRTENTAEHEDEHEDEDGYDENDDSNSDDSNPDDSNPDDKNDHGCSTDGSLLDRTTREIIGRSTNRNSWRDRWSATAKLNHTNTRRAIQSTPPQSTHIDQNLSSRITALENALDDITTRISYLEHCTCGRLEA